MTTFSLTCMNSLQVLLDGLKNGVSGAHVMWPLVRNMVTNCFVCIKIFMMQNLKMEGSNIEKYNQLDIYYCYLRYSVAVYIKISDCYAETVLYQSIIQTTLDNSFPHHVMCAWADTRCYTQNTLNFGSPVCVGFMSIVQSRRVGCSYFRRQKYTYTVE